MSYLDSMDLGDEISVLPRGGDFLRISAVLPTSGTVVVAALDGADLVDEDSVYYAFYDHLRFPEYFGWNWDALSDCLRDLNWLPAERYIVIIDNAELLLASRERDRRTLFSILRRSVKQWSNPMLRRRPEVESFGVILICAEEAVQSLKDEVGSVDY